MLNRVCIVGRLTEDPKVRTTDNDIPVANFCLAVERDYVDRRSGEREPDFIDVTAWRGLAEFVGNNFHKGKMAIVEGRLETSKWVDDAGNNRRSTFVVAENIYFAGDKRPGGSKGAETD